MIKQDQLWPGGFRFLFDDELFKPGTDSFLLGSFPRLRRGERVCDLGAGTGLLGLLLLAREPDLQVTNVELQAAAVALAEQNTALNGLSDRVRSLRADLREPGQLPEAGSFDLVVSNPPYFDAARGAVAQTESRGLARSDETCTLPQRLVQNTAQSAPKLLLLEAKKGGRPGLAVLPPLLLRDPDGGESKELSQIYFRDKE